MMWQTVLKAIPQEKTFFAITIVNAASTAKLLKEIEEADLTNESTQNTFTKLRGLLITIEGGNPSIEDIIAPYSNSPVANLELSQIKENITKLKDALIFMTISDVKAKVEEGLEAKTNRNHQLVEEILQEIDEKGHLSERTLRTHKVLRTKLEILRLKADKSYLSFEGLPKNSKLIEQFAKLIGGEVKGDIILVDYTSRNDFIQALNPQINKKTGEILDNEKIVKEKAKIKAFYNEHLKSFKLEVHIRGNVIDVNDLVAQGKLFIASDVKLSIVEPFNEGSVVKYIKAVDNVKGSVRAFRPKTYPSGADTSKLLFLDKSSPNSMNLNPYSELILLGVYTGETWFKTFFDSLRQTQMLNNNEAQAQIIDSIYASMKNSGNENKHFRASQITSITNSVNRVMGDFRSKTAKSVKSKIIEVIEDSNSLGQHLEQTRDNLQSGQLQYLKGNFTIKEAADFKRFYSQLDKEEYPENELKLEYFRDGSPTADIIEERDEEDEVKRDEKGSILTTQNTGKEKANYAKIILDGDELTPESAYEFGLKVTTPKERSTPIEEIMVEGVPYKYSEGKEEKKNLETTKKKRQLLSKRPLGKTSQGIKETQRDRDAQLEIMDEKIKRLERDIKAVKEEKESGITPKDIGEKTQILRNELLNTNTFKDYVLSTAKKLKGKGGLIKLVNEVSNSSSALDQISPERSLGFLAQMAHLTSNNEVREAFKTIDADPESDNAINTAKQLDDTMPSLITKMKEATIGAFRIKLEAFATNPSSFPPNQIMNAKKQFVEKQGILKVGE